MYEPRNGNMLSLLPKHCSLAIVLTDCNLNLASKSNLPEYDDWELFGRTRFLHSKKTGVI
ncbi:MAG TPA: hypothetical protein VJ869_11160 [Sphaerochaeta sp.]|nr:hypothetical protein [Sphaerochaeta sp.]